MSPQIQIGKHNLVSNILVAPMSGISDLPFRRVTQKFGPGLVVSEMVASDYLSSGDHESVRKIMGKGDIDPLCIQLVGREAHWMAQGARIAQDLGAEIIDINMGCPARRVTKGLSGSALMRDLDHAMSLIDAVIAAVDVPVTLKMRLGWDHESLNAAELAQRAEQAGVQMVVVHGRTRCQFYKGHADWARIAHIKQAVTIPVFVNGDILNTADAKKALSQSGADGVMLGRGLIGAPWRVARISAALNGCQLGSISPQDQHVLARDHYLDMIDFYGEHMGVRIARKHLSGYVDQAEGDMSSGDRQVFKTKICQGKKPTQVLQLLEQFYGKLDENTDAAA
jgi:nifR3 family TIM-barrel protein